MAEPDARAIAGRDRRACGRCPVARLQEMRRGRPPRVRGHHLGPRHRPPDRRPAARAADSPCARCSRSGARCRRRRRGSPTTWRRVSPASRVHPDLKLGVRQTPASRRSRGAARGASRSSPPADARRRRTSISTTSATRPRTPGSTAPRCAGPGVGVLHDWSLHHLVLGRDGASAATSPATCARCGGRTGRTGHVRRPPGRARPGRRRCCPRFSRSTSRILEEPRRRSG